MRIKYLLSHQNTIWKVFSNKFNSLDHCVRCISEGAATIKWKARLEDDVEEQLRTRKIPARRHPGVNDVKCVRLPEKLHLAISNVLSDYSIKDMKRKTQTLVHYLASRKKPVESEEIDEMSREVFRQINEQRGDMDTFPPEEKEFEAKKRKDYALSYIRTKLYHWKPIEYDAYKGLLYLLGRSAPNYAVLFRVFSEIAKSHPDFEPTTLFDFGSGIGSTTWAANSFWSSSLREYFNVDISDEMNDLSRLLLQGGKEGLEELPKGIFYRQFLPASNVLQFNLVVSAFSLLELPSTQTRLQTIDALWKKTQNFLVIVEDGTNAGYEALLEARDFILEISNKDEETAHVFAPCPHNLTCPRFVDETNTPCNFVVRYEPYGLTKNSESVTHRFSYVVLSKTPRIKSWPRIVRPVLCRGKHVVCRMCTNEGKLTEIILTKSKHGTELYKCGRLSQWGDSLPISELVVPTQDEVMDSKADENEENSDSEETDEHSDVDDSSNEVNDQKKTPTT